MAAEPSSDQTREDQRVLRHVCARMAEAFPDAPPAVVHEAVTRALAGLADARVREYLAIFVERDAAALLGAFSSPDADYAHQLPRFSEAT